MVQTNAAQTDSVEIYDDLFDYMPPPALTLEEVRKREKEDWFQMDKEEEKMLSNFDSYICPTEYEAPPHELLAEKLEPVIDRLLHKNGHGDNFSKKAFRKAREEALAMAEKKVLGENALSKYVYYFANHMAKGKDNISSHLFAFAKVVLGRNNQAAKELALGYENRRRQLPAKKAATDYYGW